MENAVTSYDGRNVQLPDDTTNDEFFRISEIVQFLLFMQRESAPLPTTNDELGALLRRWLSVDRRDRFAAVSAARKLRVSAVMREAARMTGGCIVRRDGAVYFRYDAHGEVAIESVTDFWDAMEAYKGTHVNFAQARALRSA